MIEYYLSNNNETCYSNFSAYFSQTKRAALNKNATLEKSPRRYPGPLAGTLTSEGFGASPPLTPHPPKRPRSVAGLESSAPSHPAAAAAAAPRT